MMVWTLLYLMSPEGYIAPYDIYPSRMECGQHILPVSKTTTWDLFCEPSKILSQSPIPPLRKGVTQ